MHLRGEYPLAFRDWDAVAGPFALLFLALTVLSAAWAAVSGLSNAERPLRPIELARDAASVCALIASIAMMGALENFLPAVKSGAVISFTEWVSICLRIGLAYTALFHLARHLMLRLGASRSAVSYALLLVPVIAVGLAAHAGVGLFSGAERGHAHRLWDAPVEPGAGKDERPRDGQYMDFDRAPAALALDGEGRLICAGGFRSYAGRRVGRIVRLERDGKLDLRLRPMDQVRVPTRLAVSGRGDIYAFTGVYPASDGALIKIAVEGEPDRLFIAEARRGRAVAAEGYLAAYPDGRVVASHFLELPTQGPLVRLEPQGYPDAEFNERVRGAFPEAGPANAGPIQVQSTGKVLVGIDDRIYRLSPRGVVDTSFLEPRERFPGLREIFSQGDEALYYYEYRRGFSIRTELLRVSAEGYQLINFILPSSLRERPLRCAVLAPDGTVYLGYDDDRGDPLVRLSPSGGRDMLQPIYNDPRTRLSGRVSALALDADGRLYVAGDLSLGARENPRLAAHLIRLTPGGELDPEFRPDW